MIEGIDISHWNGKLNFLKLRTAGVEFCYAKCVDGATNTDDAYGRNRLAAESVAIPFGAYVFAHPTQDPTAQIDFLLAQMGQCDLAPMLDFEWAWRKGIDEWTGRDMHGVERVRPVLGIKERIAHVCKMIARVKEKLGVMPFIYTSKSFWDPTFGALRTFGGIDVGACPLWVVDYDERGHREPRLPAPWQTWKIRQYDGDEGKLAGYSKIDRDWFNGTLDELKAFHA
jgi:GH25 family lysozyme M1 (1,4-beta-N-acetylmuramidase)